MKGYEGNQKTKLMTKSTYPEQQRGQGVELVRWHHIDRCNATIWLRKIVDLVCPVSKS